MSDLENYFELDSDSMVAGPLGLSGPSSRLRTRKSILAALKDWKRKRSNKMAFTILSRQGRQWIGGINIRWPHAGVAEIGYAVAPRFQGNGFATEAVRKIVETAFRGSGAHRIQATCWVENKVSARVLKKAGLRKEGTLRGYLKTGRRVRDEFMFGMTRADWERK